MVKKTFYRLLRGLGGAVLTVVFGMSSFADVIENTPTKPIPLQPIQIPFPWFAASEVSGYAEVLFEVDEKGQPRDFIVLKETHRAFSQAVIDTIKQTRFDPARIDGQPTSARVIHKNHFVSDRQVAVRKIADKTKPYRVDENTLDPLVFGLGNLDEPVQRIRTTAPDYPEEFDKTNQDGGVLIDFFIDPQGFVRAPMVISSSHESLSKSALDAIRQW